MGDLTGAQRTRLGFFIAIAVGLLAVLVIVKVGETLLDTREIYHVRMPGNVGALDPGAAVTFNGIVVGRVERVEVDPDDVAVVAIDLALTEGTRIPEDTEATVAMRGITGLKYVELTGGTNKTRRREPGEQIPAGRSMLDDLQDNAVGIAAKLDGLLGDARALLYGASADHIEATLASLRRTMEAVEDVVVDNAPRLARLIERVDEVGAEVQALLVEARVATATIGRTASAVRTTMNDVGTTVKSAGATFDRIAAEQVAPLAKALTIELGRAGSSVRHALNELVRGFDSVGSLADMLRADPSSLLLGRRGKERELP